MRHRITFITDTVMASGNGMMYIELGTDETPGARGFQIAIMLSRKYMYLAFRIFYGFIINGLLIVRF